MASIEDEIKQKNFHSEQIKMNVNILFTANWLTNQVNMLLRPYNLKNEQFNVLRILRGKHPETMCQKDILERMISPQSNVTLIIKRLKDKKLIKVSRSEIDKRLYTIGITKEGLNILAKLDDKFKNIGPELSKLSDEDARTVNRLLDKLRDN